MRKDLPPELSSVLRTYQRVELLLRGSIALFAAFLVIGMYWLGSFVGAILIALGIAALLRIPLIEPCTETRLWTEQSPEDVHATFAGPRPPVLAIQWGLADAIAHEGPGETQYTFTPMFRRGTGTMIVTTTVHGATASTGMCTIEAATTNHPWATLSIEWTEKEGGTIIDVIVHAERGFGLSYASQGIASYVLYDQILASQGLSITNRSVSFRPRNQKMRERDR